MFWTIRECQPPPDALLGRYASEGDYADCFATDICGRVTLEQYLSSFYTTAVFKLERFILKWLVSAPSTDEQVAQLAAGTRDRFAAWHVEERIENQILLTDYRARTRSWLMVAASSDAAASRTRLYFGSIVVAIDDKDTADRTIGAGYRWLLGFHRIYSRVLLNAARRRLTSHVADYA